MNYVTGQSVNFSLDEAIRNALNQVVLPESGEVELHIKDLKVIIGGIVGEKVLHVTLCVK